MLKNLEGWTMKVSAALWPRARLKHMVAFSMLSWDSREHSMTNQWKLLMDGKVRSPENVLGGQQGSSCSTNAFFHPSVQRNLKVVIAMSEIIRGGKSYFESKTCPLRIKRQSTWHLLFWLVLTFFVCLYAQIRYIELRIAHRHSSYNDILIS